MIMGKGTNLALRASSGDELPPRIECLLDALLQVDQ